MHRREEELVRVGVRLVLIAAVVGLLVLLLHGTAYPAEDLDEYEAAQMLLVRDPLTSTERVEQAEQMLRSDRRNRIAITASAFAETVSRGLSLASPTAIYKTARKFYGEVRRWRSPSASEPRVLDLLEPDVHAGAADERMLALYQRLHRKEEPSKGFGASWPT